MSTSSGNRQETLCEFVLEENLKFVVPSLMRQGLSWLPLGEKNNLLLGDLFHEFYLNTV